MKSRYYISILFLLLGTLAIAKEIPPKPNPPRLVNDFAGMLNPSEKNALEQKLVAYNDSTSTQVAIVTERTLDGDDVFDYSFRIAKTWGIGQEGKGNGILIYVALDDRKIFIQTGRGAEGFLPDAIAKRIIENIIKPAFKEQRYYDGFDRATSAIISYGAGEYKADDQGDEDVAGAVMVLLIIIAIFLFIVFAAIRASKNRNNDDDDNGGFGSGGRYNERSRGGGGWLFIPPIGGGGGWNSGGGGGGFGGFGGGDFGGGGAGGDW